MKFGYKLLRSSGLDFDGFVFETTMFIARKKKFEG